MDALADPEDEKRVSELERLARIKVAELLRSSAGGLVTVRYVIEGGKKPRVSRDSALGTDQRPLTREPI